MIHIIFLLLLVCLNARAGEVITYPQPESAQDRRNDYPLALLTLALKTANADYTLQPSPVLMRQNRSFTELAKGQTLRIAWAMTSMERESKLLPIRIPISKGLIGWRFFLVRQDRAQALGSIRQIKQLRSFKAGQGVDWPDTAILKANGLPVETASSYEDLFKMLAHGRFDYMPRSMIEIWAEAKTHQTAQLVITPQVVLHYPTADYFFVNKHDTKLAAALTLGLERAIANGSFDRLFKAHYSSRIQEANLAARTVIELRNPLLPKETPVHRTELWFKPQDLSGSLTNVRPAQSRLAK